MNDNIADLTEAVGKVDLFPMNFGVSVVLRDEIDSAMIQLAGDEETGIKQVCQVDTNVSTR